MNKSTPELQTNGAAASAALLFGAVCPRFHRFPRDQTETHCPVLIFLFAFSVTFLLIPVSKKPAASVLIFTQMHGGEKKKKVLHFPACA